MVVDHGAALRLFAAAYCYDPDDCVQQAFIKLTIQHPPPTHPVAWLYRVVKREALGQRRSARRRANREAKAAEQAPRWFVDQQQSNEIDPHELTKALQQLDDDQREIVIAKIWGNLKFEEIAEIAGCSTSAAHRRFHAALDQLRDQMGLSWLVTNRTTSN